MRIFGREVKPINAWRNRYAAFGVAFVLFFVISMIIDYCVWPEKKLSELWLGNLITAILWAGFMTLMIGPVKDSGNPG